MEGWTAPDTVSVLIAGTALVFTAIDFVVSWRRANQDREDAQQANATTRSIAEMAQNTADRVAKAQEVQAGFATAQAQREAARDLRQRLEAFIEDLEGRQKYASDASFGLALSNAVREQDGYGGGDDGSIGAYNLLFQRIDDLRGKAAVVVRDLAVNRVTVEFAEKELRRLDQLLARVSENDWPPKDLVEPKEGKRP